MGGNTMFKNIKIGTRLALSYGIILLFMVGIILVGMNQIKISEKMFDRIIKVNNVRLQLANNMIKNTREVSIALRNILLLKDSKMTTELIGNINSFRKNYDEAVRTLEGMITADDTTSFRLVSTIKATREISRNLNDKVIELAQSGKIDEAIQLMNEQASKAVAAWIHDIDLLIVHNEDRSRMLFLEVEKIQSLPAQQCLYWVL